MHGNVWSSSPSHMHATTMTHYPSEIVDVEIIE
jgi:hypothetical protein